MSNTLFTKVDYALGALIDMQSVSSRALMSTKAPEF